jgi:predicted TIM-barrel fold metal-dependent hydrolase
MLEQDGVDRALVAIPGSLGIEALPRREAVGLIDAHLDGVEAFGTAFGAWGPLALDGACAADVDRLLERGCIGVSLPAGALASPGAPASLHAVLRRVEQRGVPLFVHPGAGLGERLPEASLIDPTWWPAMTRAVAQMHQAWLSLGVIARRIYPRLRVVFAMLAGGAPLLDERLIASGGPSLGRAEHLTFYDTSSYGPLAIESMARRVGESQLVYGSDRPAVEPVASGHDRRLRSNAALLTHAAEVAA